QGHLHLASSRVPDLQLSSVPAGNGDGPAVRAYLPGNARRQGGEFFIGCRVPDLGDAVLAAAHGQQTAVRGVSRPRCPFDGTTGRPPRFLGGQVPQVQRAVLIAHGQGFAVRRDGADENAAVLGAVEAGLLLAGDRVPQFGGVPFIAS